MAVRLQVLRVGLHLAALGLTAAAPDVGDCCLSGEETAVLVSAAAPAVGDGRLSGENTAVTGLNKKSQLKIPFSF
jgi:hypothetical protein